MLVFLVSKEELAVEIYYSLIDKIMYPERTNTSHFGMLTKSYDEKYWVYSDLLLSMRQEVDMYYWLSLYVTNGTHYTFVHKDYRLTIRSFNEPHIFVERGFYATATENDRFKAKQGDVLERYQGFMKFRY